MPSGAKTGLSDFNLVYALLRGLMADRISVAKFAEETGFGYRTMKRYIKNGQVIPYRTPGGRPYFKENDIALMKAGKKLTADRFEPEVRND